MLNADRYQPIRRRPGWNENSEGAQVISFLSLLPKPAPFPSSAVIWTLDLMLFLFDLSLYPSPKDSLRTQSLPFVLFEAGFYCSLLCPPG